jgi:ribonuclease HII
MVNPLWTFDRKRTKSLQGVIGVDEAGRGCLAGPVVAGAVILPSTFFQNTSNRKACSEMNDSKQIKENLREELFEKIVKLSENGELFWASGSASVEEIESENIVGATCLAMKRAMSHVSTLSQGIWKPLHKAEGELFISEVNSVENSWIVSVDGRPMKKLSFRHEGIIKGDSISLAIAMGSLVAKVTRDRLMRKFSLEFPLYDFSSNKGYGSPKHILALKENGPSIHHRPKFLRNLLDSGNKNKTITGDMQSRLSFS